MTIKKAKCVERTSDAVLIVVMITMLTIAVYSSYYMEHKVFGGETGLRYYTSFILWVNVYLITACFFLLGSIGLLVSMASFKSTIKKLDLECASIEN
jgi:hypothetical protein